MWCAMYAFARTTERAVARMQAAGRKTLMPEDATEAFRSIAIGDSAPVMDPATLFRQLDRMAPAQVFEVVRLVQKWLAAQQKTGRR